MDLDRGDQIRGEPMQIPGNIGPDRVKVPVFSKVFLEIINCTDYSPMKIMCNHNVKFHLMMDGTSRNSGLN